MEQIDYRKDWEFSLVYRKAMANEAIKRNEIVESEFIVREEEENGYMT